MPTSIFEDALAMRAADLGFDICRVTHANLPGEIGERLAAFLASGHHGTMDWMAETQQRRSEPTAMWPQARSAILLGMNYGPETNPLEDLTRRERGNISVYARNRDYHDVIKGKLKTLAGFLASRSGEDVKVFVDTAPIMEKPLAVQAGLGWQGKHTNLVSRDFGSWLFLGCILTSAALEPNRPEEDHCGNCRACLDVCPTKAFPAPYRLDARRCISYLTIEHAGPIPRSFRHAMGNRVYGCDDCLAVCPWNKFARQASETKLQAREEHTLPALAELAELDDTGFRKRFSASPVKRIGRDRFLRNVMIAVGNSRSDDLLETANARIVDESPLVRGAAIWAYGRLAAKEQAQAKRDEHLPIERHADVIEEWQAIG